MSILPRTLPKFPALSERGEACLRAASYCDLLMNSRATTDEDAQAFKNARTWLLKLVSEMENLINNNDPLPTVLSGAHLSAFDEKGSYEFLLDLIGMQPPSRVSMPLGAGGRLSSLISAYNIKSSEEFGRTFRKALEKFTRSIPQWNMRDKDLSRQSREEMEQARDLFIRAHGILIAQVPYDYSVF